MFRKRLAYTAVAVPGGKIWGHCPMASKCPHPADWGPKSRERVGVLERGQWLRIPFPPAGGLGSAVFAGVRGRQQTHFGRIYSPKTHIMTLNKLSFWAKLSNSKKWPKYLFLWWSIKLCVVLMSLPSATCERLRLCLHRGPGTSPCSLRDPLKLTAFCDEWSQY